MKIGIDARNLFSIELKGIGAYLEGLITAIASCDKQNEYILYYDSRQNVNLNSFFGENFEKKGISIRFGDTFYLWEQMRLPMSIFADKIDLFHGPSNTLCFTKCPNIVTIHDTILQMISHKRSLDQFYYSSMQPFFAKRANFVITDSVFSKTCIIDQFRIPQSKIKVIYPGIDSSVIMKSSDLIIHKTNEKYKIHAPFILSAGGESIWKNIEKLIDAFSVLHDFHDVNEDLLIVGIRDRKILNGHLQKIRRLNLAHKIKFLGYIPKEDLIALYSGASVFVYPSLWEGFGFPPLEAMACEVPVVASNAASIPEVVGDAAVLCNAKDPSEIALAIKRVLDDSGMRFRLVHSGLKRINEFSWVNSAEKMIELYTDILEDR
jgi:glycosyltransferase involved in cell wall biosynthesis